MTYIKKISHLTRAQQVEIIERWVNNPNIGVEKLGEIYGVHGAAVSYLISRVWFYKMQSETSGIIVKQSTINDSVAKIEDQLELQLTA